jgi:hypothetical protein
VYVNNYTKAGSYNNCCSSIAINIIYSDYVFVALGIQRAMMSYVVISGFAALQYFLHYLIKGIIFEENIEHKMFTSIFSTSLSETFSP